MEERECAAGSSKRTSENSRRGRFPLFSTKTYMREKSMALIPLKKYIQIGIVIQLVAMVWFPCCLVLKDA
jgi:hypothetical protein